jgi:uroporphyrinogen-III synthase
MYNKPVKILSTKTLSDQLIQMAMANGVDIDIEPFISIEPVSPVEIKKHLMSWSGKEANFVFTSGNAVEASKDLDISTIKWNIFTLEGNTKSAVEQSFLPENIKLTAPNAKELADKIVAMGDINEIVFCCGDRRRDELPELLRSTGIAVNEIICYQTVLTPVKLEKEYQGILFFSPSAVESYLMTNELKENTVIFSIGDTTAKAFHDNKNEMIISEKPIPEILIKHAISYFRNTGSN